MALIKKGGNARDATRGLVDPTQSNDPARGLNTPRTPDDATRTINPASAAPSEATRGLDPARPPDSGVPDDSTRSIKPPPTPHTDDATRSIKPPAEDATRGIGSGRQSILQRISRIGTIAGCYVTEGTIDRKSKARVIRDGTLIYTGELSSLKRFKDDVREVREGFECGIGIANFNDVKVGDVIECFKVEEVARTLAGAAAGR